MSTHSRPASPSDFQWYQSEGDEEPIKPKVKVKSMAKVALPVPSAPRPKRAIHPSNKVVDPANAAKASLSSHQHAIEARRIAEAEVIVDHNMMRSTPEAEDRSLAATPTTTVASSPEPEPASTAKRANPTTDLDSDSDNVHEPVRHRKLYLFDMSTIIYSETQVLEKHGAQCTKATTKCQI